MYETPKRVRKTPDQKKAKRHEPYPPVDLKFHNFELGAANSVVPAVATVHQNAEHPQSIPILERYFENTYLNTPYVALQN